jgi:hypothetical protein
MLYFGCSWRPGSPQPACDATIPKPLKVDCSELRFALRRLLILFLVSFSPLAASCQQQNQTPKASSGMGVSTGTAHPAVKDSKSRPITAGGFVDGAPVVFIDVTAQAGFDRFHHRSGTVEKRTILETPGSGVALLDYDNDGWLEVFLLNGSTFDALKGQELRRDRCSFTTITRARLPASPRKPACPTSWGFGVAVGDYDNDGWPDIYVANYGKNRLYHRNHDGTVTDVAEKPA